jgi:hypothetical protein
MKDPGGWERALLMYPIASGVVIRARGDAHVHLYARCCTPDFLRHWLRHTLVAVLRWRYSAPPLSLISSILITG